MSKYMVDSSDLTSVADAIRSKTGTDAPLEFPDGFVSAVGSIENKFASLVDGSITTISSDDLAGITKIGEYAFYGNDSLKTITIPDNVISIGKAAFDACGALTNVTLLNTLTEIPDWAFNVCKKLTSINIPSSVTSIGYSAFNNCQSLSSISIPSSVKRIDGIAFNGCSSLKSVYITDIDAWCKIQFSEIYSNPLFCAQNLYLNGELVTDLIIPNGVTSIGDFAFVGYNSLTSVLISDGVTRIGDRTFFKCRSLKNIIIPDSVTYIGQYVFGDCKSLLSITCKAIAPPVTAISAFSDAPADCNIYVPAQSVEKYKSASNWSARAAHIQAIPE